MKALVLAAAALIAAPATAQTVAIVGGTVAIGDGSQPIANGTVVFRDGRIVAAGPNVAVPAGATVVDAHGKWIAAGIVAGFTNLGLVDADGVEESNDERAGKSPFAAAIDIAPWINPAADVIGDERLGGVTRAIVAPGSAGSIFAGQGAVIDLGVGAPPVTKARAFQYVELGEDGGRQAGGSRPAAFAMFRDALAQAADYRRSPTSFGGREKDSLLKRGDAEALLAVIDGRMPLMVHVERASDILAVLALPATYPRLKLVLLGATEGWMAAHQIEAAHVPVIAAAIADLPAAFEKVARDRIERWPHDPRRHPRRDLHRGGEHCAGRACPDAARGQSGRFREAAGGNRARLGAGVRDDHVEAGAGDGHGRRDRFAPPGSARGCRTVGRRSTGIVLQSGRDLDRRARTADDVAADRIARPLPGAGRRRVAQGV